MSGTRKPTAEKLALLSKITAYRFSQMSGLSNSMVHSLIKNEKIPWPLSFVDAQNIVNKIKKTRVAYLKCKNCGKYFIPGGTKKNISGCCSARCYRKIYKLENKHNRSDKDREFRKTNRDEYSKQQKRWQASRKIKRVKDRIRTSLCLFCKKPFQTTSTVKKFCSEKCCEKDGHRRGWLKKKVPLHQTICPQCGKWFMPKRKDKTFCSELCYSRSYEKNKRMIKPTE